MKIRPLHIVSAGTLGLASIINAASAVDDNKKDPAPPQEKVQLTPSDIPKLIEKKLTIPEELFDGLLDKADPDSLKVFNALPQEIKTKIAKRAFNEHAKAIKTNSPDLDKKEQQMVNLTWYVHGEKLKSLLTESKMEFQNLIESYLDAIADKENKRKETSENSAAWNAWALDTKVLPHIVMDYAPEKLFKESWYTKIEKITERIDEDFKLERTNGNGAKMWAINSIVKLSKLESKGSTEPKLYKTLMTLAEKGYIDHKTLVNNLPEQIQTELVKKSFSEVKKALTDGSKELGEKEYHAEQLLGGFEKNDVKNILLKTKTEYQDLIEAYINAIASEENKRVGNANFLEAKLLTPHLDSVPPALFKETWYPNIEKIAKNIDKDFKSEPKIVLYSDTNLLLALSSLELRKDSGIKEPKLYKTLISFVDKGYIDSLVVVNSTPEYVQTELVKAAFNGTRKALVNNTLDIGAKESNLKQLLDRFQEDKLKTILLKSKTEYQDLIEAYINVLADKENKRQKTPGDSASWNGWALDIAILGPYLKSTPPGLFKEAWYPKIDTIINRANKEFEAGEPNNPRKYTQDALTTLIALEHKQDSGVKEPQIFQKLVDTIEKNPKAHFPKSWEVLHNCIVKEATLNDNPKGSRVLQSPHLIVPKESLVKSYENLITKITNDLPLKNKNQEDEVLHDSLIKATVWLACAPINRPQLVIDFQDKRLSEISKANLEDMSEALTQLQGNIVYSFPEQNKVINAGKKHFPSIINAGLKGLLDEDSKKNELGLKIIITAQNFYQNYSFTIPVAGDKSFTKLINSALDRFQNKELKDEVAIRTYLDFISHIKKEGRGIETEPALAIGLNSQAQFTQKAKEKAVNAQELLKLSNRDLELLRGTNQLMGYFNNNSKHLKHIEPLFKTFSQDTLRNAFRVDVLKEGTDLLIAVAYFPTSSKDEDKENRRFYKETVMPYFNSLLEGSKNLSGSEKKVFQEQSYQNLSYFFRAGSIEEVDHGNLFILDDTLKSISRNYFSPKNENKLDQFTHLSKSVLGRSVGGEGNLLWMPYMTVKTMHLQKDYLNDAIKESGTLLDSPKISTQVDTLETLSSYKRFLEHMKFNLDSTIVKHVCTKDEKNTAEAIVKNHLDAVNGMFIEKFGKVKVITEKTQTFNHLIQDDVFVASTKTIEDFILRDEKLRKQFLGIIDERLKIESDPHTRGMLYKTMAKLNPDKTIVLERFKKAIVIEQSPITARYIGEELGQMFFNEVSEIKALRESFPSGGGYYYNGHFTTQTALENLSSELKKYGAKIKSVARGELKVENTKLTSDFILMVASTSRGKNMEVLLKENLSPELVLKFENRKEGEAIDSEIIKAAKTILSNSNSMLSGFVRNTSYEELAKQSAPINHHLEYIDPRLTLKSSLEDVHANITNVLEINLRWFSTPQNIPHISASLVHLYNKDDEKINALGERLFKGTKDKLPIYELYQEGLSARCIWKYVENCRTDKRNSKEDIEDILASCHVILRKMDKIVTTKNIAERKTMWRDLELDIVRLDPKLYSEMVRTPLANLKIRFLEEFIELAPNRQRREYLDIALGRFGLREHISEQELHRILGISD